MTRWILPLLLLLPLSNPTALAKLPRWDALPAMDMQHLLGPHAGQQVCPVCTYGYDAGVLVALPHATPTSAVAQVTAVLRATLAEQTSSRFRVFLLFTGGAPSAAALATAHANDDPRWQVGWAAAPDLAETQAVLGLDLARHGYGAVFAQRRLIFGFPPLEQPARWPALLPSHARYAMDFLQRHYPQTVESTDHDTPRGALWMAPNGLTTMLDLRATAAAEADPPALICLQDADGMPQTGLLLMLSLHARTHFHRPDPQGCLSVRGLTTPTSMTLVAERVLRPTLRETLTLHTGVRTTLTLASGAWPTAVRGTEAVVGGCEGCEAAFAGLPAQLEARTRIVPTGETGTPLHLQGRVTDREGRPQPGVVIYVHQTDASGHYPPDPQRTTQDAATRHGRLRGWVHTDEAGRYHLHTVRPGAYPGAGIPAHIHLQIIEPGRCTYFVGDVLFADDPLLDAPARARAERDPGGSGITQPVLDADGVWQATRDITLGLQVDGYAGCGS